jgi:hypothetical protein
MAGLSHDVRLVALTHGGGGAGDRVLCDLARRLAEAGVRLAGVVQDPPPEGERPPGARKPPMTMRFVDSGEVQVISEDLGPMAVSCRLDAGALEAVAGLVEARLAATEPPQLLLLPKFSKREAEGGGFRQVMGLAVGRDVPVLTTLKADLGAAFLDFAGDLGAVVDDAEAAFAWALAASQAQEHV